MTVSSRSLATAPASRAQTAALSARRRTVRSSACAPSKARAVVSIHLAVSAEVSFEFGEDAEHGEKALSESRGGVDGLLGCLQGNALGFEDAKDVA